MIALPLKLCRALHEGHGVAHLAYFGAVAIEGHGFYAMLGGLLLVLGLMSLLVKGAAE